MSKVLLVNLMIVNIQKKNILVCRNYQIESEKLQLIKFCDIALNSFAVISSKISD